jgi:peptidoglycan/LPS O-acetylase OafA/YrhL
MGIAIYRISTDRGTIWTYLVIAAALFLCSLGGGPISYNAPPALYLLVGIFAGGAVWLAVTAPPKFLVSRPILFLGAISYPFYLVHFRPSYLVMAETPLPPALSIAAAVLVSIAVAAAIHWLIEVPGRHALRTALSPSRSTAGRSRGPGYALTRATAAKEVM